MEGHALSQRRQPRAGLERVEIRELSHSSPQSRGEISVLEF